MELHLNIHFKYFLDPEVFKAVRNKMIVTTRRFKQKIKSLKFGRKIFFKTFSKNFFLLENLLIRLISHMYKQRTSLSIDRSEYEEVMKKAKIDKKFSKKLLVLEEELKNIRARKEDLTSNYKQHVLQIEKTRKKQEFHLKMQEKARARQEDLKNIQRFLSNSPNHFRPRYLRKEDEFISATRLEESSKIQSVLKHKSEEIRSVSIDEIRDHARHYKELILYAQNKRKARLVEFSLEQMNSPKNIYKKILAEEREETINSKKQILAKRKNYAELVKELFVPKISISKFLEKKNESKTTEKIENFQIGRKRFKRRLGAESLTPKEKSEQNLSVNRLERNSSFVNGVSLDNFSQVSSVKIRKLGGKEFKGAEKVNKLADVENEIKANEKLLSSVKYKMKCLEKLN